MNIALVINMDFKHLKLVMLLRNCSEFAEGTGYCIRCDIIDKVMDQTSWNIDKRN